MKVSKEAHVKFRPNVSAMCICCKIQKLSWCIAVILGFESGGCGTIGNYDGFELECSVVPQRKIRTRRAIR